MKTQIRSGSFETNSSSSHAFITNDVESGYYTILPDDEGVLTIQVQGQFEWGTERWHEPEIRAAYILLDLGQGNPLVDKVTRVIADHTGARKVRVQWPREGLKPWDGPSIDHQSRGVGSEVAAGSDDTVKDAIFAGNTYLLITNDNHDGEPLTDKEREVVYTYW